MKRLPASTVWTGRRTFKAITLLFGATLLALLLGFAHNLTVVEAANPKSSLNAGSYCFTIGRFRAAILSDGLLNFPPFPTYAANADPQEVERAMVERFWSPGSLAVYFNVIYIDTGAHKVLIDTGAGKELGAGLAKLTQNLHSIGVQPQEIDTVIVSHAHPDHIGGIVASNDQLTFANAQYYISDAEWQFWMAPSVDLSSLKVSDAFKQAIAAAARKHLGAIIDRVNLFQPNQEIIPGITAISAAGHTPGQSAFQITSGSDLLIVAADVFFNQAFDLEHPEWQTAFDLNPRQAVVTRRQLLDQIVTQRTMVMAYHMPFPALGHIRARDDHYEWEPVLWRFD